MTQPSRPRFPFFKDEKFFGIPTRVAVRLFIVAVLIFAVVVGWGAFKILGYIDTVDDLAKQVKAANIAAKKVQAQRHDERLADQKATDLKIRQLYCSQADLIMELSRSPRAKKYAATIRKRYSCSALPAVRPVMSSGPTPSTTSSGPSTDSPTTTSPTRPRPSSTTRRPEPTPSPTRSTRSSPARASSKPSPRTSSSNSPLVKIPTQVPLPSLCVPGLVCS